jgi:hypothetical protein
LSRIAWVAESPLFAVSFAGFGERATRRFNPFFRMQRLQSGNNNKNGASFSFGLLASCVLTSIVVLGGMSGGLGGMDKSNMGGLGAGGLGSNNDHGNVRLLSVPAFCVCHPFLFDLTLAFLLPQSGGFGGNNQGVSSFPCLLAFLWSVMFAPRKTFILAFSISG